MYRTGGLTYSLQANSLINIREKRSWNDGNTKRKNFPAKNGLPGPILHITFHFILQLLIATVVSYRMSYKRVIGLLKFSFWGRRNYKRVPF